MQNKDLTITKGTVVRTIMFTLVIINFILKYLGVSPVEINENDVYNAIELIVSILVLILTFWKNNSFTKNAKMADSYLKKLQEFDKKEE